MFKDVEHVFKYLFVVCFSSFENSLFSSLAHLLIHWCDLFFCLVFAVLYTFWKQFSHSLYNWQRLVSESVGCHLVLAMNSLPVRKVFNFVKWHLFDSFLCYQSPFLESLFQCMHFEVF